MQADTVIVLIAIIIGFIIVAVLLLKRQAAPNNQEAVVEWLKTMQNSLEYTNKTLQETLRGTTAETNRVLQTNTKQLNERLDSASQVIGDLKKNLGELSEVGRGIKELQTFLQSPKRRGSLGEEVLADTIAQLFPKGSYSIQYQFKSGVKVDAAIKTEAGILPIDAKFPMEQFVKMFEDDTELGRTKAKKEFIQDVKKHLHDIAQKYVLVDEGTLDFALMYIPSEAVYYEVVNIVEVMKEAKSLRIYPVSPNTLYAHLQVLLVSFQGKEMERKSVEIFRTLRAISADYLKLVEHYNILSRHIANAYNSTATVTGSMQQLGQKLDRTHRLTDANE